MIGLGSNRLSVCRRGGMSVTQFGMAGMSRTNDFFGSPYSAQATAALKAQFPTQWPTIRDYGFAHPALVPFINEDPMMVMSLIEGLGTRLMYGDGLCFVLTSWKPKSNFKCVAKFKVLGTMPTGNAFGAARVYNEPDGFLFARSGQYTSWFWTIGGNFVNNGQSPISLNTMYNVEMSVSQIKVNGTTFGGGNNFTSPYNLCIFHRDETATSGAAVNIAYCEHKSYEGSTLVQHLVPFLGSTRQGMINVADLEHPEYCPKVGTGTFTELIESPS